MAKKDLDKKEIFSKILQETDAHHIIAKDDQEQLADIIKQLGGKPKELSAEQMQQQEMQKPLTKQDKEEKVQEILAKNKGVSTPQKSVSDEEIINFLDLLNKFDFSSLEENKAIYQIYMKKLKYYQNFANFRKLINQKKYAHILVAHLNYLSDMIVGEQQELTINMQAR